MQIAYDLNTLFLDPKNKKFIGKDPTGELFLGAGFNVSKLFNQFKDLKNKKVIKRDNILLYPDVFDLNFNAENFYNSLEDKDT